MTIELGYLIGILGTLFGIFMGYTNWRRTNAKDIQTDAAGNGELKSDINYIKRGIEDIKVDMRVQEKQMGELTERVTRVEESSKQAHKRIDELKV